MSDVSYYKWVGTSFLYSVILVLGLYFGSQTATDLTSGGSTAASYAARQRVGGL